MNPLDREAAVGDEAATQDLLLEPDDNERLANLCGQFDEHLRQIERGLGVQVNSRGNAFRIIGPADGVHAAGGLLRELFDLTADENLNPGRIHLSLQELGMDADDESDGPPMIIRTKRGMIRPRGRNQAGYLRSIQECDLTFGVGPAGTGKTWLAVACAVDALERDAVRRIVLVRPAVEAGERLGFLPGDMSQKVDPYLRPIYDALYEMMGFEKVARLVERNVIEIAPLAFMRGRTLNESFVILDEAQNTTIEQMKMFLTRIGFGTRAVVNGDVTQTDLPGHKMSGLSDALKVLQKVKGVRTTQFTAQDVVRHALVQRIVKAYERQSSPDAE